MCQLLCDSPMAESPKSHAFGATQLLQTAFASEGSNQSLDCWRGGVGELWIGRSRSKGLPDTDSELPLGHKQTETWEPRWGV